MNDAAEDIQQRMKAVRCDLVGDVDDVLRSARQMLDWKEYVRRYPWACMGAAAALGYLVVPRRLELISPDAETLLQLAKQNKLVVKPNPTPQNRRGLLSTLLTIAGTAVVRGAMAYVSQQAGRIAGEQAAEADHE